MKDGAYRNTSFIDGDDILVLTDLLSDAHRWIRDAKQQHLAYKVETGSKVNPIMPAESEVPQAVIAAEQVAPSSQSAQVSGQ